MILQSSQRPSKTPPETQRRGATACSRRRWALAGVGVAALGYGIAAPASAQTLEPSVLVTDQSAFAGCVLDDARSQAGTLFLNTAIEPWLAIDPSEPTRLLVGVQQDRWSNGGSRGLRGALSDDGGQSWFVTLPSGVTNCTGGIYPRASDPWVSFGPTGTAYFMSLSLFPNLPSGGNGRNAMLASRSTDGAWTWEAPVTLIEDTDPQVLNDKNSITADPTDSARAYAVWDRLQDFTIGAGGDGGETAAQAQTVQYPEGVVNARDRMRRLQAQTRDPDTQVAPAVQAATAPLQFKGPTYLARTTDGGVTWEPARPIYDPGANSQTIGNQLVVLPDGRLADFFTKIDPNGAIRIGLVRSSDKGDTFEATPTYVSLIFANGVITPNQQQPVRDASILFDVAVDRASGALYAVWQDLRFTSVDAVAFSQSLDGGTTWSAPVQVNLTPERANTLQQQAFVPQVKVAGDGTVVVTHYDFRFGSAESNAELTDYWAVFCKPTGAYGCASRDAWGSELRLTDDSFDLLNAPVARGHFLGDYMGLAVNKQVVTSVFGVATAPNRTNLVARRITLPGLGPVAASSN